MVGRVERLLRLLILLVRRDAFLCRSGSSTIGGRCSTLDVPVVLPPLPLVVQVAIVFEHILDVLLLTIRSEAQICGTQSARPIMDGLCQESRGELRGLILWEFSSSQMFSSRLSIAHMIVPLTY